VLTVTGGGSGTFTWSATKTNVTLKIGTTTFNYIISESGCKKFVFSRNNTETTGGTVYSVDETFILTK
jgi:hypothetical protein